MAKPNALGVYVFAGGFALGVRESFKLLAHLEQWPFGAETARRNLGIPVYEEFENWEEPLAMMARDVRKRTVPQPGVDFVFANPPCAPWSTASHGRSTHWSEDPRLSCFWKCFEVFQRVRPRVLAIESVAALYGKAPDLIAAFAEKAAPLGYHCSVLRVNAQNHGVAQTRKRVFVMLHDVALEFRPPRLDLIPAGDVLRTIKGKSRYKQVNVREDFRELVAGLNPGQPLRHAWDRDNPKKLKKARDTNAKKVVGRPSFLDRRIDPARPCGTMTGGIKHIHPTQARFITVEEMAALAGFPPTYTFTPSQAPAEIAKGVMPPVGAYLGREIARSIKKNVRLDRSPTDFIGVDVITVERDEVTIESLTSAVLKERARERTH